MGKRASEEPRSATVEELQTEGVLLVEDGNHGEYRPLSDEFDASGTPFIRPDDLKNGRVDFANCDRINQQALARIRKGKGRAGDIVFTHRATVGRIARVGLDAPDYVANPGVTVWRTTDPSVLDPTFLYFYMQTAEFMNQVWAEAGNTDTFPYVSLTQQRRLRLSIPSMSKQRAVAEILGTLDDKIELNRRMNETLEAMARALFKSWFVGFDPVRAKAQGRKPAGLDPDTAKLFPKEFVDSDLGEIPKGWEVAKLAELTSKIGSGATPRGGESGYVSEGVALIRSQNVYDSQFVWDGLARISDEAAEDLRGVTVQSDDVLLNITGASILRTCVVDPSVLPARVNQHVAIIRARSGIPPRYLHEYLLLSATKSFLMGMDAGASRQAVTKGHIESVPLLLPPSEVLDAFRELSDPVYSATVRNTAEARTLAMLRDALLPKLLAGQLTIAPTGKTTEDRRP